MIARIPGEITPRSRWWNLTMTFGRELRNENDVITIHRTSHYLYTVRLGSAKISSYSRTKRRKADFQTGSQVSLVIGKGGLKNKPMQ